jgi:HEAT repeat protein
MSLPAEDQPDTIKIGQVLGVPIFREDDPRLADERASWSAARGTAQALHTTGELLDGLRHEDWRVRHESVDRLIARGRDDPRTLTALLDATNDGAWQVRDAVAMRLCDFEAADVEAALRRCMSDEHPEVRWSAAHSLSQLGRGEPPQPQ